MSLKGITCVLTTSALFFACGGSDDASTSPAGNGTEQESPLEVDTISFELDAERSLTTLTGEEIQSACEGMAQIFEEADAGIACHVAAAGRSDDVSSCEAAVESCKADPTEALSEVDLRASPGPVDCSLFQAELTSDCDFPVSLLEDCVNSIAQSVVPAAAAVSCDQASDFGSVTVANQAATEDKDGSFGSVCLDLTACQGLIGALLGGESSGAGGAAN